ncbi:MAG: OB-fold nucleic acid binding domain-containing protein, partial [Coriobacteriia bacterium]
VPGEGIRFGLEGIRGVGSGVVDLIVAARRVGGGFTSLQDFCARVDVRQVNKKTLEALIKAGAFDSTGYTRKHLLTMMDSSVDSAVKRARDVDTGQVSMFDLSAEESGFSQEIPAPDGDEWDKKMRLAYEKEMLGIYVSDHPLREIAEEVRRASDYSLGTIEVLKDGTTGWFAGMLSSVALKPTKKGPMMAIVTLEDLDGSIEAVLFPVTLEKCREAVKVDAVVRLRAKLEDSDRGKKLIVLEFEPFDGEAFRKPPGVLTIRTDATVVSNGRRDKLIQILEHHNGRDFVELHMADEGGNTIVARMQQTVDREAPGLYAELIELLGGDAIAEN